MFRADIRRMTLSEFEEHVRKLDMSRADFNPTAVCIHHTFRPNAKDWGDGSRWNARLTGLRDYYAAKNWHSGPHAFLDPKGVYVYTFTPLTFRGVHALSFNHIAWGVEAIGDFGGYPGTGHPIPELQFDLICRVTASLLKKAGKAPIANETVLFHRDDPQARKTCPGLYARIDDIMAGVREVLAIDRPVPVIVNGTKVPGVVIGAVTWAHSASFASALGGQAAMSPLKVLTLDVRGHRLTMAPGTYRIRDGRAFVPVRAMAEKIGATILIDRDAVIVRA